MFDLLLRPQKTLFDSGFSWMTDPVTRRFHSDIDVQTSDDKIVVTADVPGISKEDISVTLTDGILEITGEKKCCKEETGKFYRCERTYGKFTRSISLPADVDEKSIVAALKDGVLKLTLQRTKEQPRQIVIQ